jgi:uroporphyrinogen III methyltransferase/synthase
MGLGSLKEICRGLLDAGVGPNTPGAVIEQGTTAKQRKVSAVLADLAEASQNAGLAAPAVIVIGEVCSLADRLAGAESKPLAGIRIGVTAPRRSGSRLAELFREAGAEVLEIPTIQIRPIPETPELQALLGSLTGQEWFGFTSPAGVEVFFDKLKAYRQDVRSLGGVKFAGVGRATSQALRDRGILADFVPAEFSGGELGTGLAKIVKPEERVILPRSRRGGEAILGALRAAGLDVLDLPIYDTAPLDPYRSGVLRELLLEGLDWLAFTSASGVEGFAEIFGTEALHNRKALCIGDQTAQGASQYGLEIFKADQPGLDSMVETLIRLNKKIG